MKTSQLPIRGFVLSILALCMLSSISFPTSTLAAESRTWTSEKGNTIKASYVRKDGLLVVLQTPDGRYVKIGHSALSSQDQKYLAAEHSTINAVLPNGEKYVASGKSSVSVITYNPKRHRQIQEHYRQQNKARQKRLDQSSSSGVYGGRSYNETKRLQQLVHLKKWGKSQESDSSPVIWKGRQNITRGQTGSGWRAEGSAGPGIIQGKQKGTQGHTTSYPNQEWKRQEDERIRRGREWDLAEQARRKKERLERERLRKEDLKFQAGYLADKIKRSERKSFPGYRGMANEADNLSMEADMVGESGASMGFGMAASKLRDMERKSFYNERDDSSFGSSMNNSTDAANDVEWGASSMGSSYK